MALGKGLGALLGEEAVQSAKQSGVSTLPISKVEAATDQPRKNFDDEALQELAKSIKLHGILQPITVRQLPTGYYSIIAGERRWRAARIAGLKEVPVNIIEADDKKSRELALIENLQREDLDDMEIAFGFKSLMQDYGLTQEDVAVRMGLGRSSVANTLRLINLPEEVQEMIRTGALSAGHGRCVLSLDSKRQQIALADMIVKNQLSVRQSETVAQRLKKAEAEQSKQKEPVMPKIDYLSDVEKELSGSLGHKVSIVTGKRKGKIEIEYYGGDDLQTLIDALSAVKF